MNRLTKSTIGCFEYDLANYKHAVGEFADYDAFYAYNMAVKQLGQYEDLNLSPTEIAEKLKELAELREVTRWIPVEERLPDVGKCVLVRQTYHPFRGEHGEFEEVTVGYMHQPTDKRRKPYFYWVAVSDYGDMVRADGVCPGNEFVTHWMPLPQLPKEAQP